MRSNIVAKFPIDAVSTGIAFTSGPTSKVCAFSSANGPHVFCQSWSDCLLMDGPRLIQGTY